MQDISDETEETRRLYGLDDEVTANFGRQCLMARRFAEAGVRFVQVTHSYKWDQHADLKAEHAANALQVDQPIAGLLHDLKRRGLLEDTLVLWGGEFGRTPTAQGDDGRDHNPQGFTMWLAGGGVKPGFATAPPTTTATTPSRQSPPARPARHDAAPARPRPQTLTYRYAGRDFRLTDVHGEVVHGILS